MIARTSPVPTAALVGAVAGVLALAACGSPTASTSAPTVTVWVDETGTGAPTTSSTSTPVPTVTAEQPAPTTLAVGRLRGAPRTFAKASRRVAAAPAAKEVTGRFVSPSDNIFCAASDDRAGFACEVATGRAPAPAGVCPAGGAADVGRLTLGAAGAAAVCNSDTVRTAGAPKLAYGRSTAVPGTGFGCVSEEFGVTCVDTRTKQGFFLARDTFATF